MIRPETDPERSPAARTCPDESSTRLSSLQGSVEWGNADSLALRVSDLSIEFGEAVEISLLNVSNDTVVTGNEYMYNIDQYTDAGWRETRVTIDGTPEPYTDEGVIHQPGEGYQWVIHFREDGTISAPVHDHSLTVCPTLEAGRYRFVYWGALESSLAVAFDVR